MELITLTPRTIGNKRNRQIHLKRIARLREKKKTINLETTITCSSQPQEKSITKGFKTVRKKLQSYESRHKVR